MFHLIFRSTLCGQFILKISDNECEWVLFFVSINMIDTNETIYICVSVLNIPLIFSANRELFEVTQKKSWRNQLKFWFLFTSSIFVSISVFELNPFDAPTYNYSLTWKTTTVVIYV